MSTHSVPDDGVDVSPPLEVPTSSRNRCENKPTVTITDSLTPQQLTAVSDIDLIKFAMDQIKMNQNCLFTGQKTDGRVSFRKFHASLKRTFKRALESLPRAHFRALQNEGDNLLREYQAHEQIPIFVDELNRLLFDLIAQTTDGEALDAIMTCEYSDDGARTITMDGRRALFILLQMFDPVSINTANIIKKKLEAFTFNHDEEPQTQRATFVRLVADLTSARGGIPIANDEHWSILTNAIGDPSWATFRTVIAMQNEFKLRQTAWLLDNVVE